MCGLIGARCIIHPARRRHYWQNRFTDYAADMNVALAYHNCMDDYRDDGKLLSLAEARQLQRHYSIAAERWPVPVYMHHKDDSVFEGALGFSKMLGIPYEPYGGPISDIMTCTESLPEGLKFEVIETPGHTQGCVCLYLREEGLLFCGDTIFQGAVGRTDHPGGDFDQMMASIRREIVPLPPETRLLPGHGHDTTLEEELQSNPFLI